LAFTARLPPPPPRLTPPPPPRAQCYIHDGSVETARRIIRHEGVTALWRGAGPTLAMAVPSVAVYLPVYDALHAHISAAGAPGAAPALAGAVARGLAVLGVGALRVFLCVQRKRENPRLACLQIRHACAALSAYWRAETPLPCSPSPHAAPLELVRTRAQAAPTPGAPPPPRGVFAGVAAALAAEPNGPRLRLWRGCGATLARDVPFSAIYWAALEPLRAAILRSCSPSACADAAAAAAAAAAGLPPPPAGAPVAPAPHDVLRANIVAGGLAGGFAGAVTTPLDVAKTQLQLHPRSHAAGGGAAPPASLLGTLRRVAATQGVGGLFVGAVPRAMRAAPACAIVLASYELLKARAREAAAAA
jgi:solute carrier family 25 protein 39/40